MNQKLVAIVGLTGSGKSEVSQLFVELGLGYVRFGQLTLDEIGKRGLEVNETNERAIREELRQVHGMAAYAALNLPNIEDLLKTGKDVLIDGLYSWSEYKMLKEKYGDHFTVIAVYAPPEIRYDRLTGRSERHGDDPQQIHRSISRESAQARDYAEIEDIEKAGPIAMADFTILNTGTINELHRQADEIAQQLGFTK